MPTRTLRYPRPGTRAYEVYEYIAQNPGTTKNAVITKLKMNPSVVKKCVENLLENRRIVDTPDEQGNHHYSVRGSL